MGHFVLQITILSVIWSIKARSFIFSTSIPPLNIAWSNWLLTEKRGYLETRKNYWKNITRNSYALLNTEGTHIIPVVIGSNEETLKVAEKLKSMGYYIPAIRPPTVPEGTSRLRLSLTADTKIEDVKKVLSF